jgi:hypothetical protein
LPDIDSVLQKIEEVASNRDGIATEEALILRGYLFSLHSLVNTADRLTLTALNLAN